LHFNSKQEGNTNSIGHYALDEKKFNLNRLLAIDTMTVDQHSRLTFTKEVRDILHIEAGDKIAVYRDKYNMNEFLFRIQRGGNLVANWKLNRKNVGIDYDEKKSSSSTIIASTSDGRETHSRGDAAAAPYRLHDENEIRNIMIVEDEQDVIYNFQLTLSEEGYNVISFLKSKEAVKNLIDLNNSSSYYDLVIVDIRMPELNGIQLYQMLKIINKNIKVLFISALDAADEILSMFPEISSRNIIRKPVSRSLVSSLYDF
jgi:CheY-like chemotaxis protein